MIDVSLIDHFIRMACILQTASIVNGVFFKQVNTIHFTTNVMRTKIEFPNHFKYPA